MEDKLVTVAEFDTAFDAELARLRLENEGIEAVVVGGDLVANMPTIARIKIQLQVLAREVERAAAVLQSVEEDEYSDESMDEDLEENTDEDFDEDLHGDFDVDFDDEESDQ